ncbi:MAG: universal stress protein [Bacteroidia bacterium]|nr:universal stress protein [Bacteroidia bacterium]
MTSLNKNNNNILVPTDFSEIAENALGHAIKVAEIYHNEITLLHIVDERGFLSGIFGSKDKDLYNEAITIKLDRMIDRVKSLTNSTVVINKLIEFGKPHKTIVRVAEEGNYDSIIMGSNGAEGFQSIIGSNASKVINYATLPVVVVKEKTIGKGYENIVLPIDITPESRQKVRWAVHVAKKFNSTIHVIFENSSNEWLRNKTFAAVNQAQDILGRNDVKYIVRALDEEKYQDSFAEDTLAYANEIDADLIMIMSQQEKGFSEFLLGSYAQRIVNHSARVPVMCINPKELGYLLEGVLGS